jgi:hypothetical protein
MISFFCDNYIRKYNNTLTKENCEYYIKKFKSSPDHIKNRYSYGNYLGININLMEEPILFKAIQTNLHKYRSKYKFLDDINSRWGLNINCNLQQYLPGESYSDEHMEHGPNEYDRKRIIGWMIYLNDIKNEGGTYWPQQKFKSKAKSGSLIIWPAGWTHTHYGIVSNTKEKYIITGWCSLF